MIELEIEINEREIHAQLLEKQENRVTVQLGDKVYELDVVRVEEGIYSIIHHGKSYEFEVTNGTGNKVFQVSSTCKSWEVQLIDAEMRYARNRNKGALENGENSISSPMPGKVVKIPVNVGQEVEEGETLIIISAMKMESEYKAPHKATIKEILTEEGATIEGHQPLILLD
ncbi:MAG: biotin/lipoyl-binding protein [Chlorobi bacterium]|nr:biotin/lipoyl-binding protein [Chlorobiota bacterium]